MWGIGLKKKHYITVIEPFSILFLQFLAESLKHAQTGNNGKISQYENRY